LRQLQVGRGVPDHQAFLFAAAISVGVIASGGGGLARAGAAYTLIASAADPFRSSRRDSAWLCIGKVH
jgi:hypothetical protein